MLRKYAQLLLDATATDGGGTTSPPPATAAVSGEPTTKDSQTSGPAASAQATPQDGSGKKEDTPPQAPAPQPPTGKDDPLLKALFNDVADEHLSAPPIAPVSEEAQKESPAAAAPKKEDQPEPAQGKAAAAEPAAKPRKKAKKAIVDLDLPESSTPVAAMAGFAPEPVFPPAAPVPQPPAPDPDAQYIAGLTEEQREELSEAEVAARLAPDKYKDRRARLLAWYRKLDSEVARLTDANPQRSFDENDEEYASFLATKPKLDTLTAKRVQRSLGEEEALRRVQEEFSPALTKLEHRQQEMEFRPRMQGYLERISQEVVDLMADDQASPLHEAFAGFKQSGAQAWQDHPLAQEIYQDEQKRFQALTMEYALFARGLREFDASNPTHAQLIGFIQEQTSKFKQHGGNLLLRDGKSFVSREELLRLRQTNPQEADRHWTFGHKDVVQMLAFQAKANMDARMKEEMETARRRGFEYRPRKNSAVAPKAPTPEPEPLSPPKAAPTLAKGGTQAPKDGPSAGQIDPLDVVSILHLRD